MAGDGLTRYSVCVLAHYLPQMYLKRFTRDNRLAVYDRVTGKFRRDKPRNVAAMKDFYILKSASGERNDTIEAKFLGGIETKASPVLDELCSLQSISDDQHGIMAIFMALLCTRIPSFAQSYDDTNESLARLTFRRLAGTPELAAGFLAQRRRSLPYSAEQFSAFVNSDAFTIHPDQNERIRLMIESAEEGVAAFGQMDWCLTRTEGEARFITADGPMGLIPLPGASSTYGELSPNVLKFLALSPTVCLRLSDCREALPVLSIRLASDQEVAEINAAIALAATRIVVGREEGDIEKVLQATALHGSTFIPRTGLVEWYDESSRSSFIMSVHVRHDTVFPVNLLLPWYCKTCGIESVETFAVTETLVPLRPHHYTEWLNMTCVTCGQTPRQNHSRLPGLETLDLVPPIDA